MGAAATRARKSAREAGQPVHLQQEPVVPVIAADFHVGHVNAVLQQGADQVLSPIAREGYSQFEE